MMILYTLMMIKLIDRCALFVIRQLRKWIIILKMLSMD